MDVTPAIPKGQQLITGYGGGGFKINHEFRSGSLLVFPAQAMAWDVAQDTVLAASHFSEIAAQAESVELLLIGTGAGMRPVDPAIIQLLKSHRIAVETMDTGAACRTYNVLLAEGRRVAAALIAV